MLIRTLPKTLLQIFLQNHAQFQSYSKRYHLSRQQFVVELVIVNRSNYLFEKIETL